MQDKDSRFSVLITPLGQTIEAPAAMPLLEAAEQAGVRLPSSCRSGTCRTCICRLLKGVVHYEMEWPGLLAEEKAEGWILPCVAMPRSDLVIDQPAALDISKIPTPSRKPSRGF